MRTVHRRGCWVVLVARIGGYGADVALLSGFRSLGKGAARDSLSVGDRGRTGRCRRSCFGGCSGEPEPKFAALGVVVAGGQREPVPATTVPCASGSAGPVHRQLLRRHLHLDLHRRRGRFLALSSRRLRRTAPCSRRTSIGAYDGRGLDRGWLVSGGGDSSREFSGEVAARTGLECGRATFSRERLDTTATVTEIKIVEAEYPALRGSAGGPRQGEMGGARNEAAMSLNWLIGSRSRCSLRPSGTPQPAVRIRSNRGPTVLCTSLRTERSVDRDHEVLSRRTARHASRSLGSGSAPAADSGQPSLVEIMPGRVKSRSRQRLLDSFCTGVNWTSGMLTEH